MASNFSYKKTLFFGHFGCYASRYHGNRWLPSKMFHLKVVALSEIYNILKYGDSTTKIKIFPIIGAIGPLNTQFSGVTDRPHPALVANDKENNW